MHAPPHAVDADATTGKSRDAANTRRLLLSSARRRFAQDGYSATRVRDIAADAGVNVALINRYFSSKEGLFEACLAHAREELGRSDGSAATLDDLVEALTRQVAGPANGDRSLQLLLLLRSSGDETADSIRLNTLRYFADQMAVAAGRSVEDVSSDDLRLRAQIALSTMLGIALLRASSTGLEPLASTGVDGLEGPLRDVITALLAPRL
ncbi:TetR family transcriptional regulator [Frondihabitans sp. VKM Ac-2883]|uniref:TetR/AcrR family transcriptional regulator n=1 Tax=Frondihabitans sp. VKM Ac-2883 TaxID=2783823 RepID=UPI00188DAD05|nr:TetR family transcriptional regulator [Frondihabitans sp. VKM Ac-2883]MBF4574578.1 helix-turn-helix transcriptional regulator [Frondihabitans sp. VKM Ac-2883]